MQPSRQLRYYVKLISVNVSNASHAMNWSYQLTSIPIKVIVAEGFIPYAISMPAKLFSPFYFIWHGIFQLCKNCMFPQNCHRKLTKIVSMQASYQLTLKNHFIISLINSIRYSILKNFFILARELHYIMVTQQTPSGTNRRTKSKKGEIQ